MEFTFLDMEVTVGKRRACVCVMGWDRGTEGTDFKELAHTVVEAAEFRICRAGQQAGGPGERLMLQVRSAGSQEAGFLLFGDVPLSL